MRYPSSELYPEILSKNFHTIVTVDLETTGFDYWRNEILTWSMSALDYFSLERKASIELTFKPQNLQFWGAGAEAVHGISVSRALYFDPKKKSTDRALEFISDHCKGSPQILLCHAFDKYKKGDLYDVNMIMAHMDKMSKKSEISRNLKFFQSTETYFREARKLGYYQKGVDMFSLAEGRGYDEEGEDFKLSTLCKYYKIPLDHHDAKSDREGCEELYRIARRLGGNEKENEFDLQEQTDGRFASGGEGFGWESHNSDLWRKNSDNTKRTDERLHFLQGEED